MPANNLPFDDGILILELGPQGPPGPPGGGAGTIPKWGNITGHIDDQADLMTYTGGDYAAYYQIQKVANGGTP